MELDGTELDRNDRVEHKANGNLPKDDGNPENEVLEFRDISDVIGDFGPWQRRVFIMFFFGYMLPAWSILSMVFLAPSVDFWCARPHHMSHVTTEEWRQKITPADDRERELRIGRCTLRNSFLDGNGSLIKIKEHLEEGAIFDCEKWEYDTEVFTASVVSKWDLVCHKEWLNALSQSIFMIGMLISVLVFGYVADRLGRRSVLLICLLIVISSGLLCAFSPYFSLFIVARFIVALGTAAFIATTFVLLMEVVGTQVRSIIGIAINFGWCVGYILLPGVAWLLRDWVYIQLSITLPCVVVFVIFWRYLPESPRWLLTAGRQEKAVKIVKEAITYNNIYVESIENVVHKLQEKFKVHANSKEDFEKVAFVDLLKSPVMRRNTLIMFFVWFVNCFVYYGLSLNVGDLGGNPFLNFFLAGLVEFPSYASSIFIIKYCGRRLPEAGALVLGGFACIATVPVTDDFVWLRVTLAMTGKFCITASFSILYLYSCEIFPTVARGTSVNFCSLCAQSATIIAPFINRLDKVVHPGISLMVFGSMSVIAGIAVLGLPETNGTKIPDTIEEAENIGRNKKRKIKTSASPET